MISAKAWRQRRPIARDYQGHFYRYRSVGGYDYVSDFLIAPAEGELGARHGDSGALWYLQMPGDDGKTDTRPLQQRDLRPLAVEWGSQVFADGSERTTFSVATSLSNVCKLLDVELVVEGADGVSGTWGAVGTTRLVRSPSNRSRTQR